MTLKRKLNDLEVATYLGSFMKRMRARKLINQTEMALTLDLDQSALSRVENGKQSLTAVQWFQFCERTGISTDLRLALDEELDFRAWLKKFPDARKRGFKNEEDAYAFYSRGVRWVTDGKTPKVRADRDIAFRAWLLMHGTKKDLSALLDKL